MSKKTSIRAAQGSELPPNGSPISRYPIGCCVRVDYRGEVAWHMMMFFIGKDGPPFCGRMTHPPSSPRWNSKISDSRSIPDSTIVLESAWPLRGRTTEESSGAERDPLKSDVVSTQPLLDLFSASAEAGGVDGSVRGPPPDDPVNGSLMVDHLSSVRSS